jgi:hypothetical protein
MRVSSHYGLGRTQGTLDFVDVDIRGDVALFLDPRALRLLPTEWGEACVSLLQDFFGHVLRLLSEGRSPAALLGELHEPNEIRLGFSQGRAKGRALGPELARELAEALSRSQAIRTGLLSDLEDTILMIPNIGPDLISDITANVLREPLMDYTRDIAAEYTLDLTPGVHVGPIWNPHTHSWEQRFDEILIADGRPLVLVPKAVVRKRMDFDADEYYDHYIIPQLQSAELDAASELVQLLKNGRTRVTKKDVVGKYGRNKLVSERVTLENPRILDDYRREKARRARPPLTHQGLADEEGSEPPDWDGLLAAVEAIDAGTEGATRYEFAIKDLLSALFYPALTYPRVQTPIHEGRKRIDITFTNMAQVGFFSWVKDNYGAPYVFIECKNYSGDPANPELDQLAGRFSSHRGRFGLLVCRRLADVELFRARCRDTAHDSRGFIVALDDHDLRQLVEAAKTGDPYAELPYLRARFDELVM